MKKEIEHLQPIPNKILMDTYIQDVNVQKVPETLLVTYKGHGYSVSKKLMGKRVKIVLVANLLYIYFNTKLFNVSMKCRLPNYLNMKVNNLITLSEKVIARV